MSSTAITLSRKHVEELGLTPRQQAKLAQINRERKTGISMAKQPYQRRRAAALDFVTKAVDIALHPDKLQHIPESNRERMEKAAEAISRGASISTLGGQRGRGRANVGPPNPINVQQLAQEAARALSPSAGTTPADIEVALRRQGIDWVEPFAPGRPLTPYYGYGRRLRQWDYRVGRNITTDTRPDRMPFALLKQLNEGYDIASICIRHIINDMRAMKLSFGPMDDYDGDVSKEIVVAKNFLRRPDGNSPFPNWLAKWMMDRLRYDAGTLYRERNAAGKVIALKIVDGTTVAPIVDYFGDRPIPPAPFLQQFVQGIPWDWATTDDVIYEPEWPLPESPYGVAPVETVMLNANTDVRLQLYFLQFFTAGTVPEMLLEAPEEMTDSDAISELQEDWDNFYEANQTGRHGAHWVPSGTKPFIYKPQVFDEKIAQYAMRRTIAAYGLTPQDLGFVETVNRATAEAEADVQYRLSTLPNTEIYEACLNMVLQDDLGLPIEINFDTGREKKDRLMEAQAHQIYVSIGAESADEVRDGILGLPVDNDNRLPRFWESPRLGPVPLAYMMAISGQIDPATLSPFGYIPPQPFIPAENLKAASGPPQATNAGNEGKPAPDDKGPSPAGGGTPPPPQPAYPGAEFGAPPPLLPTGTKVPPDVVVRRPKQREKDSHEQVGDMHTDPEGRIGPDGFHGTPTVKLEGAAQRNAFRVDDAKADPESATPRNGQERESRPHGSSSPRDQLSERMGSSTSARGIATPAARRPTTGNPMRKNVGGVTTASGIAGVDGPNAEDDELDDEAMKELALYRASARKKAKEKKNFRRWSSSKLPPELLDHIHEHLQNARNAQEVDKIFEATLHKAPKDPGLDPTDVHQINGLALRAADTGRVLLLQRAITGGDPAAGKWEFPGGHRHFDETGEEGAIREWEEETGVRFPKKAKLYSTWMSFNNRYKGWVFEIPKEDDISPKLLDGREEVKNPDGDVFEAVAWWQPESLSKSPDIRPELLADSQIIQNALKWPRKSVPVGMSTSRPSGSGG